MALLPTGTRIPAFSLSDDRGRTVTDADFAGRTVVLYFYPKDDTPGCTREACAFRDGLEAFEERGATVIGISADDVTSHEKFRDKYELNHPLLADPTHGVCEAFGVWGEQEWRGQKFLGIARTTFLVRDGVIAQVYPDVDVTGHAERILADL
jgi:peroxiredoxin Q/BCP